MSVVAEAALRPLQRPSHHRLTRFRDSAAVTKEFHRTCVRAHINNLRFHDLRHELMFKDLKSTPLP
ncbi:hypothetical protein [Undibacterium sp.]|uniref:hypothetical protein n=1 Tax=Undibacterium sp. TaxID=1914977 RepID=UPI002CDBE0E4|nr:hypothetical protein [Undibacterium sp.]HTD05818.1 hypothetical protein [Undibacterium sp.]